PAKHVVRGPVDERGRWYISIDYGTANPCSMGLWGIVGGVATRVDEFYHDGRKSQRQLTDEEYYAALERLAGNRIIQHVIVDPSAASFLACIRRHGRFRVRGADNAVLDGLRVTGSLMAEGKLLFHERCADCIRELGAYCWDRDSPEDRVIKDNDHAMDDMRYFCNTVLRREIRRNDWM
ncbi:MAG: PBSX family phage terminase large subunit, partial [Oscillospiraceae bacterium]